MHISPNLIRFPAPAAMAPRPAEVRETTDNVVDFPKRNEVDELSQWASAALKMQEFGQIFAAHRTAGRLADALEATPAL